MLAMDSQMHDTERRRADYASRVMHGLSATSDTDKDGDALDDNVDELDPVDGCPSSSARVRSRRRFAKAGATSYELSFSRRPTRKAPAAKEEGSGDQDVDESLSALPGAHRPTPVVSSLSSVLSEVMTGKTQALNNIIDTTPPQPNVTYVVEHAPDGTPYVAASDGNRYFENSTIGQIFLKSASRRLEPRAEESEVASLQSGGRKHQQQSTKSLVMSGGANGSSDQSAGSNVAIKKGAKGLLRFKGFHKNKKKGAGSGVVIGQDKETEMQATQDELSLLNRDTDRTNSRRRVQRESEEQEISSVRLLDSTGLSSAQQAKIDLLANDDTASVSSSTSSTKMCPDLPSKDPPAPPLAFDAYDEDDNPMCRSFQNVCDVDSKRLNAHDDADEEEQEYDDMQDDAIGDDDIPDADSPDFVGRVRVSSGATTVSEFVGGFKGQLSRRSGANGLVNRKRTVRHARLTPEEQKAADLAKKIREACNRIPPEFRDDYVSPAAQELQQKLQVARQKCRASSRHVHFNTNVLVREFDVESEEEDDGYDSPDGIVHAVQLVSKRDVLYAEDVVQAVPMEELELPLKHHETIAHSCPSSLAIDNADEATRNAQDTPLTFSQLKNDKRMSFSEL